MYGTSQDAILIIGLCPRIPLTCMAATVWKFWRLLFICLDYTNRASTPTTPTRTATMTAAAMDGTTGQPETNATQSSFTASSMASATNNPSTTTSTTTTTAALGPCKICSPVHSLIYLFNVNKIVLEVHTKYPICVVYMNAKHYVKKYSKWLSGTWPHPLSLKCTDV